MDDAAGQPTSAFTLSERREGEKVVLTVSGELDLGTIETVERRLTELREAGTPVVLNIDQLTFMDSTGIRMLLAASEDVVERSWSFRVTRGSDRVRDLFATVRVADRLPYADER